MTTDLLLIAARDLIHEVKTTPCLAQVKKSAGRLLSKVRMIEGQITKTRERTEGTMANRIATAQRMDRQGYGECEIADFMGLSAKTVRAILNAPPDASYRGGKLSSPGLKDRARRMAKHGRSKVSIAKKLGVHRSTIHRYLRAEEKV